MGKLTQLLGVANNLADSFVSITNLYFLESLQLKTIKLFEIDLLKETIEPKDLMSKTVKETIARYRIWFLSEIEKLKIKLDYIEKVTITVEYKPGKSFVRYYTCHATIRAKGKKYTMKTKSSFS